MTEAEASAQVAGTPAADDPEAPVLFVEPAAAAAPPVEPAAAPTPPPQQKVWKMPKSPVTRRHLDDAGRIAFRAVSALARFVADLARYGARAIRAAWSMVEVVPASLKLFVTASLLMLVGILGAITLRDSWGLACIVVVIPVCASILGALGHRWYIGQGAATAQPSHTHTAEPTISELERTVHYVDKKLALALTSFGTDHHQQAMIALFQAKTAVELTLGTEQDVPSFPETPSAATEPGPRPRIRPGAAAASMLRESTSLAS